MVWDICMIHGVFIPLLNDLTRTSILCGWSATGPIYSKACFHKNGMMMNVCIDVCKLSYHFWYEFYELLCWYSLNLCRPQKTHVGI